MAKHITLVGMMGSGKSTTVSSLWLHLAGRAQPDRPAVGYGTRVGTLLFAAMLFNYLGYHSPLVDLGVWLSLAITIVSSLHYIWHARRIIDAPASA